MKKVAVLVHGWDPKYYNNNLSTKVTSDIAWSHRKRLVKLLRSEFQVKFFNLPGFCNTQTPNKTKSYNLEDFTRSLDKWLRIKNISPDIFIGYSFGGSVLLDHLVNYKSKGVFILISPAIIRKESSRSRLAHLLKLFLPSTLIKLLKHPYQYLASKYYRKGDPFLRESYDLIARRDLRNLLGSADKKRLLLIYGNNDIETPWQFVQEDVIKHSISQTIILGGGHSIGQTHPDHIIKAIHRFLAKTKKHKKH